mgnify:CR=1 FL=1
MWACSDRLYALFNVFVLTTHDFSLYDNMYVHTAYRCARPDDSMADERVSMVWGISGKKNNEEEKYR